MRYGGKSARKQRLERAPGNGARWTARANGDGRFAPKDRSINPNRQRLAAHFCALLRTVGSALSALSVLSTRPSHAPFPGAPQTRPFHAAFAPWLYAAGNTTDAVVPLPSSLEIVISPSIRRASARAIDRPS